MCLVLHMCLCVLLTSFRVIESAGIGCKLLPGKEFTRLVLGLWKSEISSEQFASGSARLPARLDAASVCFIGKY